MSRQMSTMLQRPGPEATRSTRLDELLSCMSPPKPQPGPSLQPPPAQRCTAVGSSPPGTSPEGKPWTTQPGAFPKHFGNSTLQHGTIPASLVRVPASPGRVPASPEHGSIGSLAAQGVMSPLASPPAHPHDQQACPMFKPPLPRSHNQRCPMLSPSHHQRQASPAPLLSPTRAGRLDRTTHQPSAGLSPQRGSSDQACMLSPRQPSHHQPGLLSPPRGSSTQAAMLSPPRHSSSQAALMSPPRSRAKLAPQPSPLRRTTGPAVQPHDAALAQQAVQPSPDQAGTVSSSAAAAGALPCAGAGAAAQVLVSTTLASADSPSAQHVRKLAPARVLQVAPLSPFASMANRTPPDTHAPLQCTALVQTLPGTPLLPNSAQPAAQTAPTQPCVPCSSQPQQAKPVTDSMPVADPLPQADQHEKHPAAAVSPAPGPATTAANSSTPSPPAHVAEAPPVLPAARAHATSCDDAAADAVLQSAHPEAALLQAQPATDPEKLYQPSSAGQTAAADPPAKLANCTAANDSNAELAPISRADQEPAVASRVSKGTAADTPQHTRTTRAAATAAAQAEARAEAASRKELAISKQPYLTRSIKTALSADLIAPESLDVVIASARKPRSPHAVSSGPALLQSAAASTPRRGTSTALQAILDGQEQTEFEQSAKKAHRRYGCWHQN